MLSLTDAIRYEIIALLERGEALPIEYKHLLFPAERREYELTYAGKEREEDIRIDTMALPLQPIRSFGTNSDTWQNMLVFGNNLQVLKELVKLKNEGLLCCADGTPGVRLIYIDPPFGTGDEYGPTQGEMAYSAKIRGAEFIEFLRKRLIFMRDLLTSDGSIYVRLDYHFGHYIKLIMDEVFGIENFQNEIVINRFKRQLRNITRFNVATDSLFFYSRSGTPYFQEQMRERLCSFCGQTVEPAWIPMHSPGLRNPPERIILGRKVLPPRGRHWTFTQERVDQMELQGRIRYDDTVVYTDTDGNRVRGEPDYQQTEDAVVDSDWTDLKGYVRSQRYPTENPEELLERVIRASSKEGDLVLDAFAGSGTTLAVAEKTERRWIGIDFGKLSIYTIQKRMMNLRTKIGNKGRQLEPKPFTLYHGGLYDISQLQQLSWDKWRFFALELFQCRDEPHAIKGITMDGYRGGDDVLVFDYTYDGGVVLDYGFIEALHEQIGAQLSDRLFLIAPAASVAFLEDYVDWGNTRYYILRIPYSVISELHNRDFNLSPQPVNRKAINTLLDAVGFHFIQPPRVDCDYLIRSSQQSMLTEAIIRIRTFKSESMAKGASQKNNLETLSMVLVDYNYPHDAVRRDAGAPPFELDDVFYANDIEKANWEINLPTESLGAAIMLIFIDIYGNEYTEVKEVADFVPEETNL